ncbi:DNA-3-methyladenine glycosylase I [Roseisolibacter sp. H3M3-2]|uniref:DNA-3-methyladenine glycosylase I n=1 Tax=Roseisolibacter sp. H3M3-2 TaxID=3031323 RepID=UPI0023DC1242|nr:DNA-3-methyladenine glycosylase I [Roseisolibacter sp. H3M3-2]MDF1503850.1 DNA-3-methyladenine glycosylase I [Roseisolibacter sp. H3M3-2]
MDAAPAPAEDRPRCPWARKPLDVAYHDAEWGVPVRDDRVLFEFLILEAAQAGLSWSTVLAKRGNYRRLFAGFDPEAVARFDDADVARLLLDPGIVRHRQKVAGAVSGARAFLAVQAERGSFADFLWDFVDGRPVVNAWDAPSQVPTRTPLSDAVSKELKRRGFVFVGTTICYAYLQAVGVVNDHLVSCFRHAELAG